jgi:hypothetical protein
VLQLAEALVRWVPRARPGGELLYARVDVVRLQDGTPALMELELTEPSLYLHLAPPAALAGFVAGIERWHAEAPRRPGDS